jgi:hypothetical protein
MSEIHWRWIGASVKGTSHLTSGTECQDNHLCQEIEADEGSILLAFVSDGAGSAKRSSEGSRMLCETMRDQALRFFDEQGRVSLINSRLIAGWIEQFRDEVIVQASNDAISEREFACTLLGAIVGPTGSVFFQIGDGAIVYSTGESAGFVLAFWPERGEYENTTYFATQPNFLEQLQLNVIDQPLLEVALFSDGLQRLALNYQTKEAHSPFFKGFFPVIRSANRVDLPRMNEQLSTYLDSPRVNERTDDDKTLLLAVAE